MWFYAREKVAETGRSNKTNTIEWMRWLHMKQETIRGKKVLRAASRVEKTKVKLRHTHHVHFLLQLVHILLFLLPLRLLLAALLRGRSQLILLTSFLETQRKEGEKMRNQDSNSKKQIISKLTIVTMLIYRCRKSEKWLLNSGLCCSFGCH